jgi:hypothetical protein
MIKLVNWSFKELEEYTAEVSVITLSFLLVILIYLSPNAPYSDLYKDLLLMLVGGILGVLGTKNLASPTAREAADLEKTKAPSVSEDDKVA